MLVLLVPKGREKLFLKQVWKKLTSESTAPGRQEGSPVWRLVSGKLPTGRLVPDRWDSQRPSLAGRPRAGVERVTLGSPVGICGRQTRTRTRRIRCAPHLGAKAMVLPALERGTPGLLVQEMAF